MASLMAISFIVFIQKGDPGHNLVEFRASKQGLFSTVNFYYTQLTCSALPKQTSSGKKSDALAIK